MLCTWWVRPSSLGKVLALDEGASEVDLWIVYGSRHPEQDVEIFRIPVTLNTPQGFEAWRELILAIRRFHKAVQPPSDP